MASESERGKSTPSVPALVRWLDGASIADIIGIPLEILDPFGARFDNLEPAVHYRAANRDLPEAPVDELSVMTWNIKFGGGRIDFWYDGHGDRVIMKRREVLKHLEGLGAKIRRTDPDVLLLQEVDVDSRRAAHIDQMQWLLDNTKLNFGAYASQWRSSFVPTRGLGRVDMGIAILSKYPIRDAQRLALPKMRTLDRITRYFYLKRAVLTACIELPGVEPVHAVNVHTEAFSVDGTKRRHIDLFKGELDRIDAAGGRFVAGGDLNTVPPGSERVGGFEDVADRREAMFDVDDMYAGEEDWLVPLYENYQPAVELEDYKRDHRPYYTFSATRDVFWCRKLDYLFTNGMFEQGSAITHQDVDSGGMETMELSDHAPVSASLRL